MYCVVVLYVLFHFCNEKQLVNWLITFVYWEAISDLINNVSIFTMNYQYPLTKRPTVDYQVHTLKLHPPNWWLPDTSSLFQGITSVGMRFEETCVCACAAAAASALTVANVALNC